MNEKEQNLLNSILQVVSSKEGQVDEMRYRHGNLRIKSNASLSDTKPKSDNTQKIKNLHKAIKTDLEHVENNAGHLYMVGYEIEMKSGNFENADLSSHEEQADIEEVIEYAENSIRGLDNSVKNLQKVVLTLKHNYARLKQLEK